MRKEDSRKEHNLSLFSGKHKITFIKNVPHHGNWSITSTLKESPPEHATSPTYEAAIDGLTTLLLFQVGKGLILGQHGAREAIEQAVRRLRAEHGMVEI